MLAIFVKKRINKRLSIVIELWRSGSHDSCRTQVYKVEGKSSCVLTLVLWQGSSLSPCLSLRGAYV